MPSRRACRAGAPIALLLCGLWLAPGLPWLRAAPAPQGEDKVTDCAQALKSKNPAVRKQAAVALGEMGPKAKAATRALRAALLDPDEGVQDAAAAALEQINPVGDRRPARADAELVEKLRAEAQAARREAEAQADRARASEAEARAAAERAEAVARKLQAELRRQKARADEGEAALKKTDRKAERDDLARLLREKDARLADLEKRVAAERDRAVAAQIEVAALKDRNQALLTQVEGLSRALAKLKADPGAGRPAGAGKNPPRGDVEGVVKKVDARTGLVELTVGSDAGLEKGHTLEVYRLDPPKFLGTLRILEVRPRAAVARPVGKLHDKVEVGDRVASKRLAK